MNNSEGNSEPTTLKRKFLSTPNDKLILTFTVIIAVLIVVILLFLNNKLKNNVTNTSAYTTAESSIANISQSFDSLQTISSSSSAFSNNSSSTFSSSSNLSLSSSSTLTFSSSSIGNSSSYQKIIPNGWTRESFFYNNNVVYDLYHPTWTNINKSGLGEGKLTANSGIGANQYTVIYSSPNFIDYAGTSQGLPANVDQWVEADLAINKAKTADTKIINLDSTNLKDFSVREVVNYNYTYPDTNAINNEIRIYIWNNKAITNGKTQDYQIITRPLTQEGDLKFLKTEIENYFYNTNWIILE